jgi:hypothetical protein
MEVGSVEPVFPELLGDRIALDFDGAARDALAADPAV